jgi:hypothetical protein
MGVSGGRVEAAAGAFTAQHSKMADRMHTAYFMAWHLPATTWNYIRLKNPNKNPATRGAVIHMR